MDYLLPQVGPFNVPDGTRNSPRLGRTNEQVVADAHARYQEAVSRGKVFSLTLIATTTGVAAGNIVAAAAAAVTQFALVNPAGSGVNLVVLKVGIGVISGTVAAGPVFHSYTTTLPTLASIGGTIRNSMIGSANPSVAIPHALAAGSALTGSGALTTHSMMNFSSTATAQATVGEISCVEEVAGALIIPPGTMWVPTWSAAGTSVLNAYMIQWEETPL